jgi:hypothetical protein
VCFRRGLELAGYLQQVINLLVLAATKISLISAVLLHYSNYFVFGTLDRILWFAYYNVEKYKWMNFLNGDNIFPLFVESSPIR